MTNSTDLLLVGGPAHGMMVCLNRNSGSIPTSVDFMSNDGVTTTPYAIRKWWRAYNERWYWIGVVDDSVTDEDIETEIITQGFQPAWDLLDYPAPQPEQ